jgi:hypothetical protein
MYGSHKLRRVRILSPRHYKMDAAPRLETGSKRCRETVTYLDMLVFTSHLLGIIYKKLQSSFCLFPLLQLLLLLGLDPPVPEKRPAKTRPAKAAKATPEAAPRLDLGTDIAKSIPSVEALRWLPPPPIQDDSGELWYSSPSSPLRGCAGIPVSTVICKYTFRLLGSKVGG